jgi:hypothetical protein
VNLAGVTGMESRHMKAGVLYSKHAASFFIVPIWKICGSSYEICEINSVQVF